MWSKFENSFWTRRRIFKSLFFCTHGAVCYLKTCVFSSVLFVLETGSSVLCELQLSDCLTVNCEPVQTQLQASIPLEISEWPSLSMSCLGLHYEDLIIIVILSVLNPGLTALLGPQYLALIVGVVVDSCPSLLSVVFFLLFFCCRPVFIHSAPVVVQSVAFCTCKFSVYENVHCLCLQGPGLTGSKYTRNSIK